MFRKGKKPNQSRKRCFHLEPRLTGLSKSEVELNRMRSAAFAAADKFDGEWAMTNVSVVIPTYNRLALLKESIASVRIQSHPASEIIVVDDGSTDGTLNWCTTQNDIRVLHCNRGGPSAARNIEMLFAAGGKSSAVRQTLPGAPSSPTAPMT